MSDWKEFSLGEVADPNDRYSFSGGPFGSNLKSEEYTENGVRIIQLQNIGDGTFKNNYKIYTSEEKADELFSCNIYPGEIILSKMGDPVARATLIPSMDERYLMASDGIRLKVDPARFDSTFILNAINSPEFRGTAESVSVGSTRKRIGLTTLKGLTIYAPPLPEQKKIAEILSGIDRSIQAKELSIQKTDSVLRARKDDLMAGVEEWHEFELGELLTFRNGLNTEKENFGQGVPFVSYKNVYSGGIVTTKSLSQSVSLSAVEVERFSLRSGDILFTRTSETPDEIGFSCVFDDKHGSAVFNGFCIRGRSHEGRKLTPDFASFYLRSESVLAQMRFLCKYTTRAGISAESLSKVKVRIPDQRTQQQLANSLIAVNEFRTTQEKSVRNLKNVKKAVSADLLSGRKRVSI
jgi:restriction endonuclease S subunit